MLGMFSEAIVDAEIAVKNTPADYMFILIEDI